MGDHEGEAWLNTPRFCKLIRPCLVLCIVLSGLLVATAQSRKLGDTQTSGGRLGYPLQVRAAILSQLLALVLQYLVAYLEVAPDSIEVLWAEEVTWPDTCLGLPAPAMCAPGETPGYRITLRALGQEYVYHTNHMDMVRFAGPGEVPRRP